MVNFNYGTNKTTGGEDESFIKSINDSKRSVFVCVGLWLIKKIRFFLRQSAVNKKGTPQGVL